MRRPLGLIAIVSMLIAVPCRAFTRPSTQESVERMFHRCAGVARVRIVVDDDGNSQAKVVERFKGDVPDFLPLPRQAQWRQAGDDFVVFAAADQTPAPGKQLTWALHWAIDLTQIQAYTFAGWSQNRTELLDRIRAEAKRPASLAHVVDGLVDYPLDERFYAMAYRFMDSPDHRNRLVGIGKLRSVCRPEDHERLRRLLVDPYAESSGRGREFNINYPVRAAAASVLEAAGESVAGAVIYEPHFTDVKPAHYGLAAAPPALLLLVIFLLRDRRRPQTVATRLCGVLGALCMLIAILAAGLWLRSVWRVDQALFYSKDRRIELSSTPHGLQLLRFKSSEASTPTVVRTAFPPGTDRDQLWRIDVLKSSTEHSVAGARYARGGFHRNRHLIEPAWAGVRIAYAWVIVLAVGAFVLLRFLATQGRMRRFRQLGLCPSCGYDLRATFGRCPECGWVVPVV